MEETIDMVMVSSHLTSFMAFYYNYVNEKQQQSR